MGSCLIIVAALHVFFMIWLWEELHPSLLLLFASDWFSCQVLNCSILQIPSQWSWSLFLILLTTKSNPNCWEDSLNIQQSGKNAINWNQLYDFNKVIRKVVITLVSN